MALRLPRRAKFGIFPTPLQRNSALADALEMGEVWVKRDDLTGFAWGGNKVRTTEFVVGYALENSVTDIVVSGGPTSNFAATMAAAGRASGIAVHQVAYGSEPEVYPPALCAAVQAGTKPVFTGSSDRSTMEIIAADLVETLREGGRTAMAVPRGGANSVGAYGFVAAAAELLEQIERARLQDITIVLPVGSGGSLAGLVAGRDRLEANWSVIGASVSRPAQALLPAINSKVRETAKALGRSESLDGAPVNVRLVDCCGEGFGVVTATEDEFCQRVRDRTGLLIDHTYNTKPLHWLSAHGRELSGTIIYWFTGGALGALSGTCGTSPSPTRADRSEGQRSNG
ncbi:MAG: pyridoxal-phosphate dependent enzyme [Acidimicrobiia bacterium]|nr:pyridoxal-phosphate dependent enzyme [Acidimicrobiia bacterium]